jgi:hypothetical protein
LGQILKDIDVPDEILSELEKSLLSTHGSREALQKEQRERWQQRLASVRHRIDQVYKDKLDGKIGEELWTRKAREWQAEEQQILLALQGLEQKRSARSRWHQDFRTPEQGVFSIS